MPLKRLRTFMSRSKQNSEIAKTKAYYNTNALHWASRKTDSFYHEQQFVKFANKLPKGAKVIDIGCAWGIHVPLFLGIGRFLRYEGIDISKSFLKLATRRYPQLSFSIANIADAATLPKKRYDGFISVAILMHVPFTLWDTAFSNIEKITKPGAIGYVTLPTEHPSGPKKDSDARHFTLLSSDEQRAYFKKRKWKIIHSGTCDGYTVENIWRWYIVKLPE